MAHTLKPRSTAAPQPVPDTRGTRMAVLIGPDEDAPNFITRRFVLAPGALIPSHSHPDIEHEQVVVRGQVTLTLDGREETASAGDAVYIPPGCSHRYENRTDAEAEFICVIPRTESYETEWHEDPPSE
jgi:quercetin dioxygenase-like cupin family protein